MATVTRRMAAISVLLASGVFAGCGAGAHAPSTSSQATAAKAADGGAKAPGGGAGASGALTGSALARAQAKARAYARAVNLRTEDLPGFRLSTTHEKAAGMRKLELELLRCIGPQRAPKALAEAGSGDFERRFSIASVSVSSEVTVARTPALAAKQLAAYRSGRLPGCLSHYFGKLLESQKEHGAHVSPVSIRKGSPPAPGASGSYGLRFKATVALHGLRIPLYVDMFGFVEHSAEVSLLATGIPEPLPARAEEQLFRLLLERARSHSS
jgi:hypothetical protein